MPLVFDLEKPDLTSVSQLNHPADAPITQRVDNALSMASGIDEQRVAQDTQVS